MIYFNPLIPILIPLVIYMFRQYYIDVERREEGFELSPANISRSTPVKTVRKFNLRRFYIVVMIYDNLTN